MKNCDNTRLKNLIFISRYFFFLLHIINASRRCILIVAFRYIFRNVDFRVILEFSSVQLVFFCFLIWHGVLLLLWWMSSCIITFRWTIEVDMECISMFASHFNDFLESVVVVSTISIRNHLNSNDFLLIIKLYRFVNLK